MATAANWANRTVWTGDNLDVLRGMNSDSVDLIYLDPPFNSNRHYEAPIGSKAAGAAFKDAWTLDDVDLAWHGEIAEHSAALYDVIKAARLAHGESMMSYLVFMAVRLVEMRRVLNPTGSLYLHCDPTASHYLKLLLDVVMGQKQFRNEIIWCYRGGGKPRTAFARKHDVILFYTRGGGVDLQRRRHPRPVRGGRTGTHGHLKVGQSAQGRSGVCPQSTRQDPGGLVAHAPTQLERS